MAIPAESDRHVHKAVFALWDGVTGGIPTPDAPAERQPSAWRRLLVWKMCRGDTYHYAEDRLISRVGLYHSASPSSTAFGVSQARM